MGARADKDPDFTDDFCGFLQRCVTNVVERASMFFLRFWRRTHDRLLVSFAVAFALVALNQALAAFSREPVTS